MQPLNAAANGLGGHRVGKLRLDEPVSALAVKGERGNYGGRIRIAAFPANAFTSISPARARASPMS
jgi:hypothetical protein